VLTRIYRVYQSLTRPDRPVGPDPLKRPWRAAALSAVLVGGGQLANRQLEKGVLLFLAFYGLLFLLLTGWLIYWLVGRPEPILVHLFRVGLAVAAATWLVAILDAWRTARALRDGRQVVRYSLWRQGLHLIVGKLPVIGAMVPDETVAPDEVKQTAGQAVKEAVKGKVIEWVVVRVLRYAALLLGVILIVGVR
jgi:hypothetical protein